MHVGKTQTGTLSAVAVGLLLLAAQAMAGTEAEPEVTDPAGDVLIGGEVGDQGQFPRADLLLTYVEERGSDLVFHILASGEISGGQAGGQSTTAYEYIVHVTAGGTEVEASAISTYTAITPGGVASAAERSGTWLNLTVPKTALAESAPGTVLSGLFVESTFFFGSPDAPLAGDRAPDGDAFGSEYTLAGGSSGNPDDTDADGLNDTWEQEHFSGLDEDASGDPDDDGCTNACEQQTGTDPNNADTDGDGASDGEEIEAGTDPLDPSSRPAGSTTSTTGAPTGTTTSGTHTGTSGAPTGTGTTGTTSKASPLGLPSVVLALAAGILLVRRRLA